MRSNVESRNAPSLVPPPAAFAIWRSEEHTSELQSLAYLVCRLLLEKKKKTSKVGREPVRSQTTGTSRRTDYTRDITSHTRLTSSRNRTSGTTARYTLNTSSLHALMLESI